MLTPDPNILTLAQAAKLLGISRGRVYQFVQLGRLPSVPLVWNGTTYLGVERAAAEAFRMLKRENGRPRKRAAENKSVIVLDTP